MYTFKFFFISQAGSTMEIVLSCMIFQLSLSRGNNLYLILIGITNLKISKGLTFSYAVFLFCVCVCVLIHFFKLLFAKYSSPTLGWSKLRIIFDFGFFFGESGGISLWRAHNNVENHLRICCKHKLTTTSH